MSAAERLRESLADQRRRGVAFDDAWARARALALEGEHGPERATWRAAFGDTRDAWEAVYAGARAADLDTLSALRYRHGLVAEDVVGAVAQ